MIAMCLDDICPSRDRCHRHAASGTVPLPQQAYSNMRREKGEPMCLNWWPKECAPPPRPE